MADEEYEKKMKSIQEYIPFLNTVIEKLRSDAVKHNRQQQLTKMESIRAMILGKRKLKIETLNKCEDVIRKLQTKMMNIDSLNNGRPNKRKMKFNRPQREHSPVRFPHENFHGPPRFFRPNFFRGGKRGRFREFKRPRLQDMYNAPSFEEELEWFKNLKREEPPEMWENEGEHFESRPSTYDQEVNYNLEIHPQAEWVEQEMPHQEYYNGPHMEIKREPVEMYPEQDFNNCGRHDGFAEEPHEEQHPSASTWPEWKGYGRGGGNYERRPFNKFHNDWQNYESDFNQDANFTEDSYEMNFEDDSQRQYHTPYPKKLRGITFASRTTNVNIYTHHYEARNFYRRRGFGFRGRFPTRKFPITARNDRANGPINKKPIKEGVSDVNPEPEEILKRKPVKSKITVINTDNKSNSEEKVQIDKSKESKKKNPVESKLSGLVEKSKAKEKATSTITSAELDKVVPVSESVIKNIGSTLNDEATDYDGLILMDEYILDEPLSTNKSTEPIKSIEEATISKENIECNIGLESPNNKSVKALPIIVDINKPNEGEPSFSHMLNNATASIDVTNTNDETLVVINPSNTTSSEVVSNNKPIKRTPIELMLMDFFDLGDLDKLTSDLTIPTSPENEIEVEPVFSKLTESVLVNDTTKTNTADEAGPSSIVLKSVLSTSDHLNKSPTNTELNLECKLQPKSIKSKSRTSRTSTNLDLVTANDEVNSGGNSSIVTINTQLNQGPSKPIESTSIRTGQEEKSSGIISDEVPVTEKVNFHENADPFRTKSINLTTIINVDESSSIKNTELNNTMLETDTSLSGLEKEKSDIFLESVLAEQQRDNYERPFIETVENKSCLARKKIDVLHPLRVNEKYESASRNTELNKVVDNKKLIESAPSTTLVESNVTPVKEAKIIHKEIKPGETEEKETEFNTADLSSIKETNVSVLNGKNNDSRLSVKSTSSSNKVECENQSKDYDKNVQRTPDPISKKSDDDVTKTNFDNKPSTSKVPDFSAKKYAVEKVTTSPAKSNKIESEDETVNLSWSLNKNATKRSNSLSKKRKIKQKKANTKKPKIDKSKSDGKPQEKTTIKQVIENKTENTMIKQKEANTKKPKIDKSKSEVKNEEKINVKQVIENKAENKMTPPKNDKSILTTFFSNLLSSDDKKQQKNAILSILTSFSTSFSNKQMKELSEVIAEDEEEGDKQESNQVESDQTEKNVETKKASEKSACKKKKSELDKLHENLNDMLTENDVFGNDGRRSCRKKSTPEEKPTSTPALVKKSETVTTDIPKTDRVLRNPETRSKTVLFSSPDRPRQKSTPTLIVEPKPMKIILQKISQARSSPWKIQQLKEGNDVKNETSSKIKETPKTQTKSLSCAKEKVLNVNTKSETSKVNKNESKAKSKPTIAIKENKVENSNKCIKVNNKITAKTDTNEKSIKPQQSSSSPNESSKKDFCKHCGFTGRFLAHHYKIAHPNEEVDSSKFTPSQSQQAIEDARVNMELYEKQEKMKFNGDAQLSYQCRFCPINMKNGTNFHDHITVHTGEFRRGCSGCHFKCSNSSTLTEHLKNVHPNYERTLEPNALKGPILYGYVCGSCNYVQIHEENVRKHIKKHPGKNKPTIHKINLSSHLLEVKPEWLESKRFKKRTGNISNHTVEEKSNDSDTSSNVDFSDDDIDVDQLMKDIQNIVGSQSDNHDSDEFDID